MTQVDFIDDYRNDYPAGFFQWLKENEKIWREFERMALAMAARNRKRYSARTIVEVLRWNSDLRQTDVLFKISNNMTPGMARLWMRKHGRRYPNFFSLHNK